METLQRTLDVTEDLLGDAKRDASARVCIAAIGNTAAIALGNRLVVTKGDGQLSRFELPDQACGLVATEPHTRFGVAVMLRHGAVMHWLGAPGLMELERDLPAPMGAFIPGGPLVLLSGHSLHLLRVDSRGVQEVTRTEVRGPRPVGVCPTASPGKFAVLGVDGELTIFSIPR